MADQLAANALTTAARVEELVGLKGPNTNFLINAASDFFESRINRSLSRASVTEKLASFGTTRIRVSRTPIVSVTSLDFDEGPLSSDDYEIDDAEAGLIMKPGGWPWTAHVARDISRGALPGTERKLIDIVYVAGYVTPQQDGDANPPVNGDPRDLPFDIERAVISIVQQMNGALSRDPTIKSEKLMSWSVTYRDTFTGPFVDSVIRKYERAC